MQVINHVWKNGGVYVEVHDFDTMTSSDFVKIGNQSLTRTYTHTFPSQYLNMQLLQNCEKDPPFPSRSENQFLETLRLNGVGNEVSVFGLDTSNIDLGETEQGMLCAIRGCVVWRDTKEYQYTRHGPFIFHITERNKQYLFDSLRQTCFNQYESIEAPPLDNMADQIRNILERWLQKQLCESCQNSLLLWDGSLMALSVNRPITPLFPLLNIARKGRNTILAFSKKTALTAMGRRINTLVNDRDIPCLLDIDNIIQLQYGKRLRFLGKVYIAKLTRGTLSFRLDIDRRLSQYEGRIAAEDLLKSDLILNSYPESLRLAHILSRFSAGEVIAMKRYITLNHRLRIVPQPDVRQILFGPYGGT